MGSEPGCSFTFEIVKRPVTKIVSIDQELKKDDPPEAGQKLIGAMVEMLSGLDQRLDQYFKEHPLKKKENNKNA